jgi:hypothetical protein
MRRLLITLGILLSVTGCGGGSPTEPSAAGGIPSLLQGQTVNVVDGAALGNLSVRVGNRYPVTSDGSGHFEVDMGDLSK